MRVFEMIGLPGAGKTTLAELLPPEVGVMGWRGFMERERLRQRPLRRHRVAMRLLPRKIKLRILNGPVPDAKDAAWFVQRNRAFHDAVVAACDAMDDAENRELAVSLLYETYSHYGFANRLARPGDGLLLDEGLWQRLAYPLAQTGPAGGLLLTELLRHAPPLDGLVVLELPLDTAVDRVRMRAREFTQTAVMPGMESFIRQIAESLKTHGVPVMAIRADRPPGKSMPQVVSFVAGGLDMRVT